MLVALVPVVSAARTLKWEQVPDSVFLSQPAGSFNTPDGSADVRLFVRDSAIYVSIGDDATVSIFNILGHALGQNDLQAGSYRLYIPSHGIYIVRVNDKILRVTL